MFIPQPAEHSIIWTVGEASSAALVGGRNTDYKACKLDY